MGMDIISGVGYGFIVNLDDEMAQAIAEAVNGNDWKDTWRTVELLAQKHPLLDIERMYDEDTRAVYIQSFFKNYQISTGDKYKSIKPKKLTESVKITDEEANTMEELLEILNLTPNALGWYFYKTVS